MDPDPLIRLMRSKVEALRLLGSAWDVLYVEGSALDVGKRRENFLKLLLRKEFNVEVREAASTERGWDFSVLIEGTERKYSLKTSDEVGIIKVAWDGFPSIEKAESYHFEAPILYVVRDRDRAEISLYVFELEDIEQVKKELGNDFWWIPRSGTNPRGFGLRTLSVKRLIELSKSKENYVSACYKPINPAEISSDYWEGWYQLVRRLALKPYHSDASTRNVTD